MLLRFLALVAGSDSFITDEVSTMSQVAHEHGGESVRDGIVSPAFRQFIMDQASCTRVRGSAFDVQGCQVWPPKFCL